MIINFRYKAELFKNIFVQQCTLIATLTASEIPGTLNIKTKTPSSIPVTRACTATINRNLGPNKAHGHDMTSIRMLKLCGNSVLELL